MSHPELNPFNKLDFNETAACSKCPHGKYGPTVENAFGINSCTACPKGQYSIDNDGTKCVDSCPHGTHIGVARSCQTCSKGQYSDQNAQENCKSDCKTGFSINIDKTSCSACVGGQYQDDKDQTGCKFCVIGRYQNEKNQTKCKFCTNGQYQNEKNQTKCKFCTNGKYQNENTQKECKSDCNEGFFINKDLTSCDSCVLGQYQDQRDQSSCKGCKPGSFINKAKTSCDSCAPGHYQDQSDQSSCTSCTKGRYQNENDQTICKGCSAGKFSSEVGLTSDEQCKGQCPKGKYSNKSGLASRKQCSSCSKGKYSDEIGATVCKDCIPGQFSLAKEQTTCKLCPANTFARTPGSSVCQKCIMEMTSPQGASGCTSAIGFLEAAGIAGGVALAVAALSCVIYQYRVRQKEEQHGLELEERQDQHTRLLDSAQNPLEQNQFTIPTDELILQQRIGAGGCGWIYKAALGSANIIVAAKEIIAATIDPDDILEFEHEARMLTQMNHPCVLRVLGFCTKPAEDNEDGQEHKYIVTEFAPNGSLENVIDGAEKIAKIIRDTGSGAIPMPYTKLQALEWALQISSGMAYLHGKGFVHRDMKPQNVLLNKSNDALVADLGTVRRPSSGKTVNGGELQLTKEEQEAKLLLTPLDAEEGGGGEVDLAATRIMYYDDMTQRRGTPLYMAPEQYGHVYSYPVDVWAYGLTLIRLFTLKLPYPARVGLTDLYRGVSNGSLRPIQATLEDVPDSDVLALIEECLKFDEKQRPTFKEITRRLNEALERCQKEESGEEMETKKKTKNY